MSTHVKGTFELYPVGSLSGNAAEDESSRKILKKHVEKAISKLEEFHIKKSNELSQDHQSILELVKNNSGKKIGELYEEYKNQGGKQSYKTFQRKIDFLLFHLESCL